MSSTLLKSTSTVSLMTFVSRILGFVRDMVCAQIFGATLGFDAFLLAFKIPNFLRRLFAEGAFSQAFVPILSEYKTTQEHAEVQQLIHKVAGNLTVVLTGVTALGILAAPLFIMVFAPGYIEDPVRFNLASGMLRITFPYLLFISLTALAGGVLNTYQRFALPAFTPVLLNLSLIGAAVCLSPYFEQPVVALAWGVFIGGVVQLALQVPFLVRHGFKPKLMVDWKDPGVKRVLKLMAPALIAASVMQINLLVDTLFASFLPVGSLSWLYYSDRLLELPIGMFGVALATVALPHLSQHFARGDEKKFSSHLDWALKWCMLIAVPASIGLWLMSEPIMVTLFHRGAFSEHDVVMASKSLRMLAFGLVAFMATKVVISAFYARQNTRLPMKVAILALTSNVVFNFLLIGPLAHAGLALSSSISSYIQLFILTFVLWREKRLQLPWRAFIWQMLFANGAMALSLLYFVPQLDDWIQASSLERCGMLLGFMTLAFAIYGVTLWAFGLRTHHLASERV